MNEPSDDTNESLNLQRLAGWGNFRPDLARLVMAPNLRALQATLSHDTSSNFIARGLGRSYGDSAVNYVGAVLCQTPRNRFLDFDSHSGLLTCEAGVSLAEIIECFLYRGWFLPTTPGTKHITVGGAIAADVHGKNHHGEGSWGNFVTRFRLLTADGTVRECSRSENQEVFHATLGGMGLTGIILDASIQLTPVSTAFVHVHQRRSRNLEETLDMLTETEASYRYSVAWIDCLSRGKHLGRSVVMLGNDAEVDQLPKNRRQDACRLPRRRGWAVPCYFPRWVLNPWSIKAFNCLYYHTHRQADLIVDFDRFFYPLDSIRYWNRIYGRPGFVQYQALFPKETSQQGMRKLMDVITESGQGSFLAVLKSSGAANEGTLSYLFKGHTLALDFPYRGIRTEKLCARLDQILLEYGGRVYLAKDALVSREAFEKMYPQLDAFKQVKAALDPDQRFRSAQSDRLGITGDCDRQQGISR